jgi:hypothetical protein
MLFSVIVREERIIIVNFFIIMKRVPLVRGGELFNWIAQLNFTSFLLNSSMASLQQIRWQSSVMESILILLLLLIKSLSL